MSKELAKEWIMSALADLKSIRYLVNDEFLTHMVAFHGQQCVEKCFKAILEYTGSRVPKEHSTLKLYGMVKDQLPEEIEPDFLIDFDDLYIEARYPGDFGLLPHGKPSLDEAHEFYAIAQNIFDIVCDNIGIHLE